MRRLFILKSLVYSGKLSLGCHELTCGIYAEFCIHPLTPLNESFHTTIAASIL